MAQAIFSTTSPIRLREGWYRATSATAASEAPYKLTNELSSNYLYAAGRFADWMATGGKDACAEVEQRLRDGDAHGKLVGGVFEPLRTGLPNALYDYIKETSGLSGKALSKNGLIKRVAGVPGIVARMADFIGGTQGLSHPNAIRAWFAGKPARETLPALLHIGDALGETEKAHPALAPQLRRISAAYEETGLKEAVEGFRAVVPAETAAEAAQRQSPAITLAGEGAFERRLG